MNNSSTNFMRFLHLGFLGTASLLFVSGAAMAQPDAGQTLQETQQQAPALPEASPDFVIEAPRSAAPVQGGPKVVIQFIEIEGNNAFSDDALLAATGFGQQQSLDLAGMKALAERITDFYRAQGYPFARALVPAQTMSGDVLKIHVVEGVYGSVQVTGHNESRDAQAQKFLSCLKTGGVIKGEPLERATLILDDQPGYRITPIIRPGQHVGSGDLMVKLERENLLGGDVGLDNHGNRYTGRARGYADFYANSPFMLGDQFKISALYTEEDMWFGSASYSLPVGHSGLRASFGYTHTAYELGKEFARLDAHGTADVASGGLSYSLLRSQKANVTLGIAYQHKWLKDEEDSAGTRNSKTSASLPIGLNFDRRDTFGGGGITYGAFSWTPGRLDLDSDLKRIDNITAHSDGRFDKLNLDLARLQALGNNFTAFGRVSGQWSADNLDSSESFGLGGPDGVRAYPTGEGYGDEGALMQLELRYKVDAFEPYMFYDYGHVKFNNDPWAAGDNTRSVAGPGLGVRFEKGGWHADASAAWSTVGGDPQSDTKDSSPMVWLRTGYKF